MNQEAGIYRNNTIEYKNGGNYINVQLKSDTKNTNAIGAKVTLFAASGQYMLENYPVHGFQSSMQIPLHFTFPDTKVDSIKIRWPDRNISIITNDLAINKLLTVTDKNRTNNDSVLNKPEFKKIFKENKNLINYSHVENGINDFKIQPLMPNMISYSGPKIIHADINGDKLDDIYICGTNQQPPSLYLQNSNGGFTYSEQPAFINQSASQETNAVFFDADNDGDLDLYVVNGGYQISDSDSSLQDKLYLNENGKFVLRNDLLPQENISGSVVVPMDVNNDGKIDLFIGGRVIPGRYPESPGSMLLINEGNGKFSNQTAKLAPDFIKLGMVTDAKWVNYIGAKKDKQLFVCGEWMPIKCFSFENGKFKDVSENVFEDKLTGWWNHLEFADINHDGDLDLIAGNWGINSQIQATESEPLKLYYDDFDHNGYIDPIICQNIQGVSYPMATRDEMTDQIVSLRQKFPTYDSYADAVITDILTDDQFKNAKQLSVNYLHTTWFENKNGKYITRSLPIQSDYAPIYAICADDFNGDGNLDLLLCGNIEHTRIRIGKIDANYGVLLIGDGKGNFKYLNQTESGLSIKGSVRDIIKLDQKNGGHLLMLGINNQQPVFLNY
jgi:hypothetical protein